MTEGSRRTWEYAVMTVSVTKMDETRWTYQAQAWVDEQEVYNRTLHAMYWTAPLADMGREGWELVTVSPENALMGAWIEGWEAEASRPVRMSFFFKRPRG